MAGRFMIPLLVMLVSCSEASPGRGGPAPVPEDAVGPGFETLSCTSAADCLPGQMCCATSSAKGPTATVINQSACRPTPCSTTGLVQLCQSAAECPAGAMCAPTEDGHLMFCSLPGEG